MKHTKLHVPKELKKSIVQEYLTTGVTQRELYERYKLRGKNINRWITKFGAELGAELPLDVSPMKKAHKVTHQNIVQDAPFNTEDELERLKQENAALKDALDYERLKCEALDTMINLAEEHFQIPIRKKSGAKRSKL